MTLVLIFGCIFLASVISSAIGDALCNYIDGREAQEFKQLRDGLGRSDAQLANRCKRASSMMLS